VPPPAVSVGAELVSGSDRVDAVVAALADGRSRAAVRRELIATLDSLGVLLGRPASSADLSRLLDLLVLAQSGRGL
jgi:hypothetical protein